MKKKNILMVIDYLKMGGGVEKICSTFGDQLLNLGYNVSYLTFYNVSDKYPFKGKEFCLNDKPNCTIFGKIYRFFSRGLKISKMCKKNKIDYVISFGETANFPTIISKLFFNKSRIIATVHYSISDYKDVVYPIFIKLLYKHADNLVVLTKYESDILINKYGCCRERISIIPNGIDLKHINDISSESLFEYSSLFGKNFTFISIGRLSEDKNQRMLIETFNKYKKEYPGTQLLILGDGELRESLQKIASEGVFFLGNQKNVYKFLIKSNCFINTSFSESFCIAIIEAMACGLPIIATDTQGSREILNNNIGIIVKNNDEKELYKAMESIYLNKNKQLFYRKQSIKNVLIYDFKHTNSLWEKIL